MASVRLTWIACAVFFLTGCASHRAPYVTVFDSYFPAWILCVIVGVTGASIIRVLLVRWEIDEVMPCRAAVYICLAVGLAFLTSLLFFSR
ncbi:YtcA family lipoprotein [Achromobacter sp. Root565]|uniref:YtcA family lipoprotein n=1 Tax=Achromobacter sp. Root565 TaxID=1736564 RepID=UPI0006FBACDD|nr:YtcA family lipoprotein [Achromobacter sp. Root565]KRA01256.1 hypothetical protein ASD71_03975 [Achromobacter sp. Root565]